MQPADTALDAYHAVGIELAVGPHLSPAFHSMYVNQKLSPTSEGTHMVRAMERQSYVRRNPGAGRGIRRFSSVFGYDDLSFCTFL